MIDLQKIMDADIRRVVIPFFATVAAGTTATYVSRKINTPFITKEFAVSFALNTNRTLQVSFYISPDNETPAAIPNGFSVFSPLGHVDYVTGDDERKVLQHEANGERAGLYIKILAVNSDGNAHTLDAQVTIDLIRRPE